MSEDTLREPSRTPPWGSPRHVTLPDGSPDVVFEPSSRPDGPFTVFIEQSLGTGDGIRWAPTAQMETFRDREEARTAAEAAARAFRPHHPYSPRERTVLRVSPDQYVVVIRGMNSLFHFTVPVAEVLERRQE